MIKDGYYEGETSWMRLKVPQVGFLQVSRSCRTQQRRDVQYQRRNVVHQNPETPRHYSSEPRKRHDVRTSSRVWNPPNVMT